MRQPKVGRSVRGAVVESLESRQLFSCALNSPNLHTFALMTGSTVVVGPAGAVFDGVSIPPGTYTSEQFNALLTQQLTPTPDASTPRVTFTADSNQITSGVSSSLLSASVADSAGVALTTGTVTFYAARPVYDVNGTQSIACLDEAAKQKVSLGSVSLADGPAQWTASDLPVGKNWVWAEYTDSTTSASVRSAYQEITVTVPVGLHVEHAGTYTTSNPPQMAVTLTKPDGSPLIGSSFAAPRAAAGSVRTATGQVDLAIPLPAGYRTEADLKAAFPVWIAPTTTIGLSGTGSVCYVGWGGATWLSGGVLNLNGSGVYCCLFNSATLMLGGYSNPWTHRYYTAPTLAGQVQFSENGTTLLATSIDQAGTAFAHLSSLSAGHHVITVSYGADNSFVSQAPETVEFDITRTPVNVSLIASSNQVTQGTTTTLRLQVSTAKADLVTPSGVVDIYCDGTRLTQVQLGGATPSLTLKLTPGQHKFQAVYLGDANCQNGKSQPLTLNVQKNTAPTGSLTINRNGKLKGWVADADRPGQSLICFVMIDGRRYTKVTANAARTASVGNGMVLQRRDGLSVALPKLAAGKHVVKVFAYDPNLNAYVQLGSALKFQV